MKKIFLLSILAITLLGCKKNTSNRTSSTDWFEIEIVNPSNMDCRIPEVIFVTRQQEANQLLGNTIRNTYVASGLPKVLYPVGTRLEVAIKKPTANEAIPCTLIGPTYPQVHITEIK